MTTMASEASFTDDELDQVVKALGIRLQSLTAKLRRTQGSQRKDALSEYVACESALSKTHREQTVRLTTVA